VESELLCAVLCVPQMCTRVSILCQVGRKTLTELNSIMICRFPALHLWIKFVIFAVL